MAGTRYVELHAHSCWSLREGASNVDEIVGQALALGYEAMALTDHDNLYGAMEYAQAAKARGLRPITGCELTLTPREAGGEPSHVTVLAATVTGYRNICQLLSRAFKEYGKDSPRVEHGWLFEWHEGLIVLSGCREGELSRLVDRARDGEAGAMQRAEAIAAEYREVFGDQFYVELQHHDVYGDTGRVAGLAELAERVGVPIVATNNPHYHVRERHRLNDVLAAIRHRLTLDSSARGAAAELGVLPQARGGDGAPLRAVPGGNREHGGHRGALRIRPGGRPALPVAGIPGAGRRFERRGAAGHLRAGLRAQVRPAGTGHPRRGTEAAGAGTGADRASRAGGLLPGVLADP
ncbi:MAG: PHP domain-containing protein [Dehalococcoidia bacterium]|nr:PHP domain-containing protein [Dehalococcoidia bacterium]